MRLSLAMLLLGGLLLSCARQYIAPDETETFDNVIVLVPDGCGVAHMTAARWYKGSALTQDSMEVSLVRTFSANSMVTGSAAAASAFATGFKTWEDSRKAKCLSMRPDSLLLPEPYEIPVSDQWRPAATVLEGARLTGKAVGLVATCYVSHATPAAFASHWHSRDYNNIITEQIVYQGVDVVFGGGFRYLIESDSQIPLCTQQGARRDGEDLHEVLVSRGYDVITTREEMLRLDSNTKRVWGMFANGHMVHDIDRRLFGQTQPSLAEMTEKAIEVLSKNPDGFFLLVEGSQVDWASHDNDLVGMVTDYLAFDDAVRIALEFAISHPDQRTLVLVFPDHDCGGLSVGHRDIDYYTFRPENMMDAIKKADLTADGVAVLMREEIESHSTEMIQEMMASHCGIEDLDPDELKMLQDELADTVYGYLNAVIGPILSKRAGIGWTTFGHTGNDVPMFSFGLDSPPKLVDNTQIAHLCAYALGFKLDDVDERLFADAELLFEDAAVTVDTAGVEQSMGQLIVEKGDKRAIFPFFKNIMVIQQDTIQLEGLTVYSFKSHKVFLPVQAKSFFDAY
jgi:alkaline phosphatase